MTLQRRNTYSKLAADRQADTEYTPQSLWEKALEYFRWTENNPLKEEKVFSSGKKATVNKIRAMSATGFCVFAQLSKSALEAYAKTDDYAEIISRINDIIYMQKFEGAAAGLLETSFVARELGLRDQTDVTTNSKDIHIQVMDKQTLNQLNSLTKRLLK